MLHLLVEIVIQTLALSTLGAPIGFAAVRWARLPSAFLPLCMFAASSAIGYGLLFVWLFSRDAAIYATRAAAIVGAGGAMWMLWRARPGVPWRSALVPAIAMVASSWAYLLIQGAVPADASGRFMVVLPNDNVLPRYFADRLDSDTFRPVSPQPPLDSDYLASDRPPLQTAMVLAVRALAPHYTYATYQVTGTVCQMNWVLALWALASTFRWSRRERAAAFVGLTCSGFALLNSLYVWPKMLAGALCIGGLAALCYKHDDEVSRDLRHGALAIVLFTLSMLAHGGAAFSLLAVPALAWSRFGLKALMTRSMGVAAIVALALVSPWLAYQRLLDPPGNRLVKMHLAGVDAPDARGSLEAIVESYRSSDADALWRARTSNIGEQWLVRNGSLRPWTAGWIQWQQFFHLIPALDSLLIGLIGLAIVIARRRPGIDHALARHLLVYAGVTWLLWVGLMFQPQSALLHHGSYANIILLFALGAVGAVHLPHVLAILTLGTHVAVFAAGWVLPGSTLAQARWAWLWTGVAVLSGVMMLVASEHRLWPTRAAGSR